MHAMKLCMRTQNNSYFNYTEIIHTRAVINKSNAETYITYASLKYLLSTHNALK